ncbi:hypothetical protein HRbin36_01505 [bacterium HR36]|nr:hypothetical protein HRbin36_01505 [bacterium HR36]
MMLAAVENAAPFQQLRDSPSLVQIIVARACGAKGKLNVAVTAWQFSEAAT